MNHVIPFFKPKEIEPQCSFCNIPKSKAKHFFASGSGKFICGDCVTQAKQRLEDAV